MAHSAEDSQVSSFDEGSAIIRLELIGQPLRVFEFGLLMQAIYDLYFGHLWLRLADESPEGQGPADPYAPSDSEPLYIERADIGTPNLIELWGAAVDLVPTFIAVASSLGAGAKLIASAYKDFGEARKAFAETAKVELEAESLRRDLATKAAELYSEGKITSEQAAHKNKLQEEALGKIDGIGQWYITRIDLKLVSRPPATRFSDDSGMPR